MGWGSEGGETKVAKARSNVCSPAWRQRQRPLAASSGGGGDDCASRMEVVETVVVGTVVAVGRVREKSKRRSRGTAATRLAATGRAVGGVGQRV